MKNTQVCIKDTLNKALSAVSPINFPKILEENVGNFCPICGKIIFSNLLEIDGKVYLEKNCCTRELIFMENDVDFFKKHNKNTEVEPFFSGVKNYQEWTSENPNYGSRAAYFYITDKCNQKCPICFQAFNKFSNQINYPIEEIKEASKKYKFRDIVITGGEPTIREDLFEIIKTIKNSNNFPTIMTNGLKLENKEYVEKLKKAGLNTIGLQFDGFNKAANIKLRGQDFLEKKIKIIENIKEVGGLKIMLSVVISKNLNEKEMSKIIQFAFKNEAVKKIVFIGLTPPENWREENTTHSDLIKIMEKEGYFNQEYFLEIVKMHRNIYEVTRKIFQGTPLEGWFFERLSGGFNVVNFIKTGTSFQLLFKKEELEITNRILAKIISKKSRIVSFYVLIKNLGRLMKSPLIILLKEKLSIFNKKPLSSNKLIEIGFHELAGSRNILFKNPRGTSLVWFLSLSPYCSVFGQ